MALSVRVIAPDRTVWDAATEEVILPATSGQLGILAGHAPLLTALATGVMRVRSQGQWSAIAIMGGFAEVDQDAVTVLVKRAVLAEQVDQAAAEAQKAAAEATLANANATPQDRLEAKQQLAGATSLLQAATMQVTPV